MNVAPVQAFEFPQTSDGAPSQVPGNSFGNALAAAIDDAATALEQADGKAGAMAVGAGGIVDASIARAKADVALEVVSVAASRISGALNSLLQTQV
jgi:flagellar hook-basal body complex protein FliE